MASRRWVLPLCLFFISPSLASGASKWRGRRTFTVGVDDELWLDYFTNAPTSGYWATHEEPFVTRALESLGLQKQRSDRYYKADVLWLSAADLKDDDGRKSFEWSQLRTNQKVAMCPGLASLGEKEPLSLALFDLEAELARRNAPLALNIWPKTWDVPTRLQEVPSDSVVVLKSSQIHGGRFKVARNADGAIQNFLNSRSGGQWEKWMAQEYVDPFLIDGKKFHISLSVLITGVHPLKAWMLHNHSMISLATRMFDAHSLDPLAHITNAEYQLKNNPDEYDPTKLVQPFGVLEGAVGGPEAYAQLLHDLERMIVISLLAVSPRLQEQQDVLPHAHSCFELLAYDVLLDRQRKPKLMEINRAPATSCSTPACELAKKGLLGDVICLGGLGCAGATRKKRAHSGTQAEDLGLLRRDGGSSLLWRRELARATRTQARLVWPSAYWQAQFGAIFQGNSAWARLQQLDDPNLKTTWTASAATADLFTEEL